MNRNHYPLLRRGLLRCLVVVGLIATVPLVGAPGASADPLLCQAHAFAPHQVKTFGEDILIVALGAGTCDRPVTALKVTVTFEQNVCILPNQCTWVPDEETANSEIFVNDNYGEVLASGLCPGPRYEVHTKTQIVWVDYVSAQQHTVHAVSEPVRFVCLVGL